MLLHKIKNLFSLPARPHDFFDAQTMDAIRHRAICLNLATHIESLGNGHSVVFHSTVGSHYRLLSLLPPSEVKPKHPDTGAAIFSFWRHLEPQFELRPRVATHTPAWPNHSTHTLLIITPCFYGIDSRALSYCVCACVQVIARRTEESGKVKVLLHWTPEDM